MKRRSLGFPFKENQQKVKRKILNLLDIHINQQKKAIQLW